MSTNQPVLSSVVIVPETGESVPQTPVSAKRRQSSISIEGNKRRRFSSTDAQVNESIPAAQVPKPAAREQGRRDDEERKRGKRLFGALLGTLNQSSSSVAQRRRGDVERKQQEKLKQQTQAHDEQQQKTRDAAGEVRRRRHAVWMKDATQTRKENTLATARFLQTSAEPKLYYKPWNLLPSQKSKIDRQIDEAQKAIEKEGIASSNPAEGPTAADNELPTSTETAAIAANEGDAPSSEAAQAEVKNQQPTQSDAAGSSGVEGVDRPVNGATSSGTAPADTDQQPESPAKNDELKRRLSEGSRDGVDDGGYEVKGDEDDVIY